jgi:hypothetical protein
VSLKFNPLFLCIKSKEERAGNAKEKKRKMHGTKGEKCKGEKCIVNHQVPTLRSDLFNLNSG